VRLLLVRHGQIPPNVRRELATSSPGPELTDVGAQQAAALPDALRDQHVAAVWASTLVRTQQTAGPLASERGLDVTVREGLREIQAGDLEMRSDAHAIDRYMSTVLAWSGGDLTARMPGAPSGAEFFARFDAAVEEIVAASEGPAVAVSHGAAIRCWVGARALNVDDVFIGRSPLGNTGIVVLEGDHRAGWVVTAWEGAPVAGPAVPDAVALDPTGAPPVEQVRAPVEQVPADPRG
jgi:probable phosphoglycerate mutase